jgi:Holliday junction resolvase RusA-like endonuclease
MRDAYTKIPFPPSIWQAYYRRGVSSVKSKLYLAFQDECLDSLERASLQIPPAGELCIEIILFSSSWYNKNKTIKKRDLDNYLKCIIDVIVIFGKRRRKDFDDSQIFSLIAYKKNSKEDFALVSLAARDPREND